MTDFLVYNVEAASPSMIRSLDRHCRKRTPDGSSAIDPARSHLNQTLIGSQEGLFASLEDFFEDGPKRPAKQAEKPYLRIVVSASPSYFRPDDPEAHGTWDEDRLKAWIDATMAQLRAEHGDDLVFAELHLDEDTPHIHAVVAPTYAKKPRKPGRKKRGESDEEFAARKAAAEAAPGVRVVGRASHPELSKLGSFQRLRERMAVALDHLGIEYGEDRHGLSDAKTTGQWVKEQAAELRRKQAELEARERELSEHRAELDRRDFRLTSQELKLGQLSRDLKLRGENLSKAEDAMTRRARKLAQTFDRLRVLVSRVSDVFGLNVSGVFQKDLDAIEQAAREVLPKNDASIEENDPRPDF